MRYDQIIVCVAFAIVALQRGYRLGQGIYTRANLLLFLGSIGIVAAEAISLYSHTIAIVRLYNGTYVLALIFLAGAFTQKSVRSLLIISLVVIAGLLSIGSPFFLVGCSITWATCFSLIAQKALRLQISTKRFTPSYSLILIASGGLAVCAILRSMNSAGLSAVTHIWWTENFFRTITGTILSFFFAWKILVSMHSYLSAWILRRQITPLYTYLTERYPTQSHGIYSSSINSRELTCYDILAIISEETFSRKDLVRLSKKVREANCHVPQCTPEYP